MASYEQGYDDERFENAVSLNFHCPICLNVFKQPVMCQRNQHYFCLPCITRHLENSQTCPSCMEELTLNTLRQAPRIVVSYLSELNIRCDYFSRGCHEFVQLDKLESHVKDCGFAPVVCSNEGCLVEINKQDRAHHEAEVCELRNAQCNNFTEMTKAMEDMKITLMETKDKLDELENGLKAVKDKFYEMEELKQLVNQFATSEEIRNVKVEIMREIRRIRHDAVNEKPSIVVAGGLSEYSRELNSVEIFNWSTKTWSQLVPMKECRHEASSFVYKNQYTVTGRWTDHGATNSMEQMNIFPVVDHFAQWQDFPAKLPGELYGHKTIAYNERLIVIGGNDDHRDYSDCIHEVLLYPPYTTELLATMPQPRVYHGAELFDDQIFILGGSKTYSCENIVNSVLMYDINNNKCQQATSLPVSVHSMATVKWGDNVVVLGGEDKDGNTLNTVIIYNVKTGKSHKLPEMKYKRVGCTAVVSGNTMAVMGGRDGEGHYLKSVECFTFDRYSWRDLPPMNEERAWYTSGTL